MLIINIRAIKNKFLIIALYINLLQKLILKDKNKYSHSFVKIIIIIVQFTIVKETIL